MISMIIYGHRGAMEHAPQNTLASFIEAQRQGADGLELDVQLSAEGRAFVFHDFTLESLTDGRGFLSGKTAVELQGLSVTNAGYPDGPQWRRIPELSEVLDGFGKTMLLNVEIKTPLMAAQIEPDGERGPEVMAANEVYVDRIAALLAAGPGGAGLNAYRGLIVSSFDPHALASLHRKVPGIPLAFLSMPGTGNNFDSLAEALLGEFLSAWHPHFSQVTADFVDYHHGKKRALNVWTVNDTGVARTLANLGVDGIITNSPERIRSALTKI